MMRCAGMASASVLTFSVIHIGRTSSSGLSDLCMFTRSKAAASGRAVRMIPQMLKLLISSCLRQRQCMYILST